MSTLLALLDPVAEHLLAASAPERLELARPSQSDIPAMPDRP